MEIKRSSEEGEIEWRWGHSLKMGRGMKMK